MTKPESVEPEALPTVDTSRAPLGVMAASQLVQTASELGDLAERHYLEIKGPLDLTSKVTGAKIGKFILGAANRFVPDAMTAFDGYAVMIVGVSKGKIEGVEQIEALEIKKKVSPFLGLHGPKWEILWVPVSGSSNHVLLVLVDPPQEGDGPFLCRDHGEGVTNGRIYYRDDGATREATAEEVDALMLRGQAGKAPAVDFAVEIEGEVTPISIDKSSTLEAYIETQRHRLLSALPSQPDDSPEQQDFYGLASMASRLSGFLETSEDRSEDEYRSAIDEWEKEIRAAWPSIFTRLVCQSLPSPIFHISNRTSTFFHDVEVKLHIEGPVKGLEYLGYSSNLSISDLSMPAPPRKWGPRLHSYLHSGIFDRPNTFYPSPAPTTSRVEWENSGSVTITLDIGDIRPKSTVTVDDEELVLVMAARDIQPIAGQWSITARDFNEVFTGELVVPVAEVLDLSDVFNHVVSDPS